MPNEAKDYEAIKTIMLSEIKDVFHQRQSPQDAVNAIMPMIRAHFPPPPPEHECKTCYWMTDICRVPRPTSGGCGPEGALWKPRNAVPQSESAQVEERKCENCLHWVTGCGGECSYSDWVASECLTHDRKRWVSKKAAPSAPSEPTPKNQVSVKLNLPPKPIELYADNNDDSPSEPSGEDPSECKADSSAIWENIKRLLNDAGCPDSQFLQIKWYVDALRSRAPQPDDSDLLTIAYMSGREDGKRARAQSEPTDWALEKFVPAKDYEPPQDEPGQNARELAHEALGELMRIIRVEGYRTDPLTLLHETSVACIDYLAARLSRPADCTCGFSEKESDRCKAHDRPADAALRETHPRIVCLCGSTRFMEAFQAANLRETIAGRIVLSIGCNTKSDADLIILGELAQEAKAALDELHKRKIDLADEVLVLNVGGYIGESTRSEIAYAEAHGKPVRYLDPCAALAASPEQKEESK